VNEAFERQTGLHAAVGKRMRELAPAHEQRWFDIYGNIALTGEPAHFIDEARALNRWYDVHAYRVGEPEQRRVAIVFSDFSDYKRAEDAHRESEERLRLALDAGSMATWDADLNSGVFTWNEETFRMMGYEPNSIQASYEAWTRRVFPEDLEKAERAFKESLESGEDLCSEYRVLGRNDEVRWVEARGRSERNEAGKAVRSFGVMVDMTERKQAEEVLKKSEAQLRTLADAIPQLCWTANADGWLNWYNRRWYEYTGTTPEQMEGWGWQSVHDPEVLPQVLERWGISIASGRPFEMVFPIRGADGVFRPFLTRVMPVKDEDGRVVRWFGTNTDISDQKQIEAELRRNQERLNVALEVAQLGEWERDLKNQRGSRSLRHAKIFGYPTADSPWDFETFIGHVLPEYRAEVAEKLKTPGAGQIFDFETQIRRTDGEVRWIWVRSHTRLDEAGQPAYAYGIVQDITERKLVEERLQRLNRTLKALSNCNQALLHSEDEAAFLHEVCRIVTEDCGYVMVWIGFAEEDERKTVRPVAWAGNEAGYLQQFNITWDSKATGLGPTGTAIRTGQPSMCRNMHTDPAFGPWREEATKRGYASSLVIPLKDGEKVMGAVTIYSGAPDAFAEDELNLLTELAGDLTFGIHTLRMRAAHAEAEAMLRESEEQLGLFVEHAPVALAMLDNQMRYIRASRRWKIDYGLSDGDLRGLSHYHLFPEVSEEWRENHRRGLAGEILRQDAERFERADGAVQWVRWEIRPWKDIEGRIGGILVFSEEITDRKRAEDALREQAELLDLAHDTIMVCDLDGTIRFWNHGAEEMYGYTKEEATGKTSHRLLNTVFPQPMSDIKARVVREGRWEGELAQVTSKGAGMIVDSRWVVQRDKEGQVRGVMEINNDITQRVQAEEAQREAHVKLQSVLDSITDGLLMLDNDWHFTYCSEHGARILGLRPEDLVGGRVWDLFPHAESSGFGQAYRGAIESREPVHFEEFYPEPLNMWLECHCYPTEEGLSVYFRDISERKRTEEALLRSEKLASVGRMAATIAHEINNPLAAITNTLYLARMRADEPASVREFLDVAEDELKRITHITRQTLGFYRESSGPVVVSVNSVLESAVDLMKSKISAKRAVIEKDWDEELSVSAIAGELRQVFSNLLGNSLDAIEEGGTIKLRVSPGRDLKSGQPTVRVTVADNGKGIAESSKRHIFEPFFTTKGTVGTGLGLWVSKQIIEKHQGKVRMHSSTDGVRRGTVFMVSLPVEPPGMEQPKH
jgi:PAS domain S-box-containing protein